MAAPEMGPCGQWVTDEQVRACCVGLDPDYDLTDVISFVSSTMFRLSGRRFTGECERTVRPCFPAGTLITTADGQQPIEDVAPGTLVLTHEGRWRRVTAGGLTGYSRLVTVKGHGATLMATPEHKVLSSEFAAFERGRKQKLGAPEWTEASHLVGRAWSAPATVDAAPDVPALPAVLDWWTVGRWLGDGWTEGDNPRSRPSRVLICCSHDEADELASRLSGWRQYKQRTATRFVIHDAGARDWLRRWFGVGAAGKQIPGWVLGLPLECRRDLLDGYVSADGSSRPYGDGAEQIRCGTVSERLAVSLRLLAASLGHAASITPRRQTTTMIEGRNVSGRDWWSVEWITSPSRLVWADEGDGRLWSRVRSVEEVSPLAVPVYNLNVEEDHSYVANGVIVKNCYGTNCGCINPGWLDGDARWWWDGYPFPTIPARLDGQWFNFGGCCGACHIHCLEGLPAPITGVSEIVIDGDILAPSAYAVRAFDSICRTDGGSFPCTNDLSEPSDAVLGMPGTWQITYTYGTPIPADAILPASIFACQVAKARCGASDCVLPARLKSIVRQGVAMAFADPMEFLDNGRVGIYEVDLWLRGVNPNGNMRAASIRRADDRRTIQTGWT